MPVTQGLKLQREAVNAVPVIHLPVFVNNRTITAAENETVPAGARKVFIYTDADIWLSAGTAAVPSADVSDGTGSIFIKAGTVLGFQVTPAQTISVISASGTAHVAYAYKL